MLVFLGIKLGLGWLSLGSSGWCIDALEKPANGFGISSCGVGVVPFGKFAVGIGGGFIMLILFNLLASVGLIVLAPNPDARPEAMDCRLLPEDDGV